MSLEANDVRLQANCSPRAREGLRSPLPARICALTCHLLVLACCSLGMMAAVRPGRRHHGYEARKEIY